MQPLCVTVHIMFRLKIEDNREVTFIQLDKRIVSFFLVATHSSRAPASGSQTGDTLGKALASVRSRLSSS